MPIATVLSTIGGISSIFGLLGILAYFYLLTGNKTAERSIRGIVEGEGLFNSQQIITIFAQFKDDAARLAAIKAIADIETSKARELLGKVEANVDINRLSTVSQRHYRRMAIISGIFFGLLAIIGFMGARLSMFVTRMPVPSDVTMLSSTSTSSEGDFELLPPNPFAFPGMSYVIKGKYAQRERTVSGVAMGSINVGSDLPRMHPSSITKVSVRLCSLKVTGGAEQMFALPENPRESNSTALAFDIMPGAKGDIPEFKFQVTLPDGYDLQRTWLCGALWNEMGYFPAQ